MTPPTRGLLDRLLDQLEEERARIERALGRLAEDAIWRRPRAGMSSAGNLCLHLAGNESHYIGHGIGGSGYLRERSREFTTEGGLSRAELIARLRAARETTRGVLAELGPEDLDRPLAIDYPQGATVLRVLLHVTHHYSYHTGQIVLLARLLQEGEERLLEWGH